ncbi:MAG: YlxR family protein [Ruminococcaceae bacterium]|nr:YlxR family protein [Oscillospiraceae bacterium]
MQNKPQKKIPQRRCVGCSTTKSKQELIRVVRDPDGNVSIDFKGKKSGRGAYICPSVDCFKKALKSKRLDNNLNVTIPEEIIEELTSAIKRGE